MKSGYNHIIAVWIFLIICIILAQKAFYSNTVVHASYKDAETSLVNALSRLLLLYWHGM